MKAVVLDDEKLEVRDVAEPVAGGGQVLVATRTCGICGTDLHAQHHLHTFLQGLHAAGSPIATDADRPVIMGHEFCGEILDHGPGTEKELKAGTLVVGLPFATSAAGAEYIGYSNDLPGGFAERMVLTEKLLFPVTNGLPEEQAALTEPFSIGAHAVAQAGDLSGSAIMVIGCGPIGLAVIAALKARGIGPIIGVDYSPGRRRFAEAMGADEVVDAARETQAEIWARVGAGRKGRRAVAIECVGRPGVVQAIIDELPKRSLLVVVGNVLEPCTIDQVAAFNKELELRFVMNYSAAEFAQTLADLVEGRIDTKPMLTGIVDVHGVPQAFHDLKDPERHAKIVVKFD